MSTTDIPPNVYSDVTDLSTTLKRYDAQVCFYGDHHLSMTPEILARYTQTLLRQTHHAIKCEGGDLTREQIEQSAQVAWDEDILYAPEPGEPDGPCWVLDVRTFFTVPPSTEGA